VTSVTSPNNDNLSDRVLAVIRDEPGISITELRLTVKDKEIALLRVLNELRSRRLIVNSAPGKYRLVIQPLHARSPSGPIALFPLRRPRSVHVVSLGIATAATIWLSVGHQTAHEMPVPTSPPSAQTVPPVPDNPWADTG
jgi:hypothetical protein